MLKLVVPAILILFFGAFYLKFSSNQELIVPQSSTNSLPPVTIPISTPTPTLPPAPPSKIIPKTIQVFQTFNNCGPAALSMALSYFGINETQQTLGQALRPFQNPQGDNDDKSVTLDELAKKAEGYRLLTYHRPAGDIEKLKLFIANDMPVITRTWLKLNDDIGHYRLIRGYDDNSRQIIQDDSLQGADLKYSYEDFLKLWQGFNYEYLVLVPKEKQDIVEQILGQDLDEKIAWEKALQIAQKELKDDQNNIFTKFNISVAYYYLGDYQKTVQFFEEVEGKLPFRTLWYQIEPILAYQKLKNYERVFALTDQILNKYNRAFSELYQIRGEIYQDQGKNDLAQEEFAKARFYK